MIRTRHLLLGTIAAALLAAGCSSGGDNAVTTSAAPATTSAPDPTTTDAPTTIADDTTTTEAEASVEDQARAALLTPAEVGPGFAAGTWTANDANQPTPCGTPSVDATVPPSVQVGTIIGLQSTSQAMREEISVYDDEASAGEAFGAGTTGLACTTGTVTFDDGTTAPLTIAAPIEVTTQVGGDQALAWQLKGGGIQGVLVAVKLSSIVVAFQFTAPDTATSLEPDPVSVAKAGMDKILNS